MTERKTLNRYYPVDYDPAKIPKLKGKQKEQNRLWGIRVMAPFNMRCNTCGDYIYKGKKFNSKKETVTDEDYLGIQIHRFYIRCPKCVAVIAFKTDPENCDYTLETGATRNFEAAKTLLDMEKKKQKAIDDEEAANPMKVLENRTKQSRNEMDMMEALTELREMNARHEKVDHEGMIKKGQLYQQELERLQQEEEDRLIRELFGSPEDGDGEKIKRIESDDEDEEWAIPAKRSRPDESGPSTSTATALLTDNDMSKEGGRSSGQGPVKNLPHKRPTSTKALLSSMVKIKKPSTVSRLSDVVTRPTDTRTKATDTSTNATYDGTRGTATDNEIAFAATNSTDLATSSTDLTASSTDLATSSTDLATSSTDLATSSTDLATSSTDFTKNSTDTGTKSIAVPVSADDSAIQKPNSATDSKVLGALGMLGDYSSSETDSD